VNASDKEIEEIFASTGPVIPFGAHRGKRISELPRNYRVWLLTQGVERKHPELYAELMKNVIDTLTAELPAADAAAWDAVMGRLELESEALC